MVIYVRNWRNIWIVSYDNYPFIMYIHLILAKSRVWQLLITPKHLLLGAVCGYTSHAIWTFVKGHLIEELNYYHSLTLLGIPGNKT